MFIYRFKGDDGKWHQTGELWHRVIAKTWIPNPDDLPQIDHIDRNMYNNNINNLRWVSPKENAANRVPQPKKHSRFAPARTVDREGNVIKEFSSLAAACEEMKVSINHALEMISGRRPPKHWGTFQQEELDEEKLKWYNIHRKVKEIK